MVSDKLVKRFKSLTAVNNLSIQVEKGSIYGLLGPNGSGKSTTLGMMLGVLQPHEGSYSWFGIEMGKPRTGLVGAMLEQPNFYNHMNLFTNLRVCALIKDVPAEDVNRVLVAVNLWDRRFTKFKNCSTGMKQRLAIANAMLGRPEVLILDEPTNGLDPQGIAEVRELIIRLHAEGHTIVLASHLLDEVEKVCTHVAVMQKGKLLYQGKVADFVSGGNKLTKVEVRAADMDKLEQVFKAFPGLKSMQNINGTLVLEVNEGIGAEQISTFAFEHGMALMHLNVEKPSLEDKFLQLTGK